MFKPIIALAFALVVGSAVAANHADPEGAAPNDSPGWATLNARIDDARVDAPEPPRAALLERAGLDFWSGVPWEYDHIAPREPYLARIRMLAVAVASVVSSDLDGVWMMALAQSETDYKAWSTDGTCNAWRGRGRGECDHGVAWGFWQQHIEEQHQPGDPTGAECVASVPICAASALRWLRRAPQVWGSHAGQKARAAEWLRRHN